LDVIIQCELGREPGGQTSLPDNNFIKTYSCIFLGLKITQIKIPRDIVERLWHINNLTSYDKSKFIWLLSNENIIIINIVIKLLMSLTETRTKYNCIVFENFTASIVDLMGKFDKNRNSSTVFEELSVSIVDLMVANIRFTGSVSRLLFLRYRIN
jgi:hypothetical protein